MTIKASCHCGAVKFKLATTPTDLTECNCTFCSKRGLLIAYYKPEQVNLIQPQNSTVCANNDSSNQHHHCSVCENWVYNIMETSWNEDFTPGGPKISVNARLFEDFDLTSLPLNKIDGLNQW